MMNFLRTLGFFAISIIVGELVRRVLSSRVGAAAVGKIGHPELATLEGAASVSKEAKRVVGFVKTATAPKTAKLDEPVALPRSPGWVGLALDSSEMLLAAGALLKVAADFVGEDEKLQKRIRLSS